MVAVGVDACKTGWIAVALDGNAEPAAYYLPTIDALFDTIPDPTAIAIDIPIGLPTAGRRRADVEARIHLGPRRNSLFITPVRSVLEALTHGSATTLSLQITGSGVSRQSYGLAAKIFEVERWLPTAPCGVWEVHPELSFALLMGKPAKASKKSWSGMVERRDVLAKAGIQLDRVGSAAASRAAVDDMLDAGVAAWTASRLLDGSARSFPDPPDIDDSGRAVAIWG
jgi:predicted RNase H-like nuclease